MAVLVIFLSCCLTNALSARCFPSFRPDTASIRSCLSLPPGSFNMRRKPCVVLLFLLDKYPVIQAAFVNFLSMRCWNLKALQIREIAFGVSHIPGAYTVLDHLFWVRLGALQKGLSLVALSLVPFFVDYDSTNILKTVSFCRAHRCSTHADAKIWRKRTPNFPCHESIHFCADGRTIETFAHNCFC